ncbi:hypothetical protein A3I99_01420 [Candidatus Kaiserbacteria bacterium RIFCSPLOWO2_02_FULL_45_11b]|uniref:Uncharacterized protein n=1 Tax=Candidatus Kaiserbacteria bacterium RIFCSPLOWO2_12_FULL_45_26 TaxID=1798525 RepID=A0A1F6FFU9_9BACT|nr:MAG: hypothetical protein A2929_01500 [Candidatus Kaiserbacteria bacterium RIFCSPLOWO2_01_FULL_45_25]OGG80976.1 MAG: hypothetical protein A3I99_01420 [Candidatus Kaiserbacteria bacterium RIFCSPLOWO2_02_FULL_45_11b]OGG84717.1 MAG: hypothetical protein A3G90_01365 [Candidatus Kaiserbacteria bacterium RIFCSPLOWO2_12_FULL_45_26]
MSLPKRNLESCSAGGRSNREAREAESAWSATAVDDRPVTKQVLRENGNRFVQFPDNWHEKNGHNPAKLSRPRTYPRRSKKA